MEATKERSTVVVEQPTEVQVDFREQRKTTTLALILADSRKNPAEYVENFNAGRGGE